MVFFLECNSALNTHTRLRYSIVYLLIKYNIYLLLRKNAKVPRVQNETPWALSYL